MQSADTPEFGKLRNFFWPIYRHELKKVFPMFLMVFLISFIYNLLRGMKIALAVSAKGSGAEIITFLKLGGVLPGALLLTFICTKLMSRFRYETFFYLVLGGFMTYFTFFVLVLFPNHDHLQLTWLADTLQSTVLAAPGFKGLVAAIRHLNLSFFYVMSEMWGAIVLCMIFWGFVNEVTSVEEAKRHYPIFALGANFAGIISGYFGQIVKDIPQLTWLPYSGEQWVFVQLSVALVLASACMLVFNWLTTNVVSVDGDNAPVQGATVKSTKKERVQFTLFECFQYLWRSRYLAYIVAIAVSYNLVYNLTDVMWTYQAKSAFASRADFNVYLNKVTMFTGIAAVLFGFFLSGNIIRYFGWTVTAMVTPVVWFVLSVGFFGGLLTEKYTMAFGVLGGVLTSPGTLILFLGTSQIVLGRALKYTIWDETKEIAFIPLSKESKRKGKAVVDGLASRFGKSGGSVVYLMLFMFLGDIANTIPYISCIIFFVLILWIIAVLRLGRLVRAAVDQGEAFDEDLADNSGERKPAKVAISTKDPVVQPAT